ncbi:MAG: FAD-binding protein, partial [Vicinamibacterales bacterium]|nr:FAD-binding protein [Vicinamibacterales bacterium]
MIVVIAEQQGGALNRASWETVAAAQRAGGPVTVIVPGADVGAVAAELAAAEVAEVVALEAPALAAYTQDGWVSALAAAIAARQPAHVFLPHTYQTRDFAPALAVRVTRALVTDCVGLKSEGGRTLFVRPVFQGRLYADVAVDGPSIATFQIGAVRADSVARGSAPAPVRTEAAQVGPIRQQPDAPFREAKQAVDLSQAERIVAVGRGIKDQEKIGLAQDLAAALGG